MSPFYIYLIIFLSQVLLILHLLVTSPTSQLILQLFRRFTYVTAHSPPFRCFTYVTVYSPTLLSLLLRHKLCSFSNLSVTSPTSQLTVQLFRRFTYVTAHSPILPLLHLRHSLFSNLSFASPTSQALLILQPLSLHLQHNSFSNFFVALPTSQLILQPFRCFTYVTAHSSTLLSLLLRHMALHLRHLASPPSNNICIIIWCHLLILCTWTFFFSYPLSLDTSSFTCG